ncbi:MAG TPA: PqqD family protein [Thermoanaerobaculia bacterium]|nr:PqqD family protein [Thermoanaerobaculia bacterium]
MLLRNTRIEEAPLQNELMLFDPQSAKFYVLNATMAFVWRRCDGGHSVSQMARELADAFAGVDPQRAESDLNAAIDELRNLGLVTVADSTPVG